MESNLANTTSITYKNLLLKKLYYSVITSVISQLVLLQVYVLLRNFSIFHPFDSILFSIGTFVSINTWLYIIPFITVIFAQTIICAKDYVLKTSYCSTRFQHVMSLFSVHNFVLLLLNLIAGSTLIWLFLSLGGGKYQNLTETCYNNNYCLNEGTFFLIISGFWTGFYYFMKVYISDKHLSFPVIHQRKFLQLKVNFVPLLKESFRISLLPSFYFALLYFLWGDSLKTRFSEVFRLLKDENSTGIEIYFYLWLFGSLYCFNMNLMKFFFNLFLTEPVEFPLFNTSEHSFSLQQSMIMSDFPIVQSLACLDLYNLAQWSKSRRQAFYTLSQPGGHPHNWNNIVNNVLKLFTEYIELLNKSTETTDTEKLSKPVVTQVPNSYLSSFQSPDRFRNLRNMSLICSSDLDVVDVTHVGATSLAFHENILEKFKQKLNSVVSFIRVMLGIKYVFGKFFQNNTGTV